LSETSGAEALWTEWRFNGGGAECVPVHVGGAVHAGRVCAGGSAAGWIELFCVGFWWMGWPIRGRRESSGSADSVQSIAYSLKSGVKRPQTL